MQITLTKKEARQFREKLAEATLQAIAYDVNTPGYLRKMAQKNLALFTLLKQKHPQKRGHIHAHNNSTVKG
jgi:hypothetical protein